MNVNVLGGQALRLFYLMALALSLLILAPSKVGTGSSNFSLADLTLGPSAALADDDDDDDDSDSGGFGGGGGFGGSSGAPSVGGDSLGRSRGQRAPRVGNRRGVRRVRRARPVRRNNVRRATRPRRARAAQPVPLPERVARELVALGLTDATIATLTGTGYTVLQTSAVERLATTIVRLEVPAGTTLEAAREEVIALEPDAQVDFNHIYRPVTASAPDCTALSCNAAAMINWPVRPGVAAECASGIAIGLVDTGINAGHDALADADLTVLPLDLGREAAESGRQHGTAVASIILSSAESRAPGLLPDAQMFAVDAFFRARLARGVQDERTDAFTLVRALDTVSGEPIAILNLSLAGPANTTLEAIVNDVAAAGIVIVASVGNGGPHAKPFYPAAYDGVIGVTAIGNGRGIFRRAGRGAHVDLAAPGIDVWTAASVRGVKPKTGTSFATPFVTAAAAIALASGTARGEEAVLEELARLADDLGDEGRDDIFGHGLVRAPRCVTPAGTEFSEAEIDTPTQKISITRE